jgi:hypothetical protein
VLSECCTQVGLQKSQVDECVNSQKGIDLQLEDEKRTIAAKVLMERENMTNIGVPRVFFNGKYNYDEDLRARKDFLGLVKEKIKNEKAL